LLLLPFFVPVLALAWSLRQERPLRLSELAQGRLLSHRGLERLVLFDLDRLGARVFDLEAKLIGTLAPRPMQPGLQTTTLPFVDGDRVLYLGGRADGPIDRALVGVLPLAGGNEHPISYSLPAPVPARIAGAPVPLLEGARDLALGCGPDLMLLRTSAGWARLPVRACEEGTGCDRPAGGEPAPGGGPSTRDMRCARLVERPPAGCRPLAWPVLRPEIPPHTAVFGEAMVDGISVVLGAPYSPPPFLLVVPSDRSWLRMVRPPRDQPVLGGALARGQWVLFAGRDCVMGTLRLTLADLSELARRSSRWTVERLFEPGPGCAAGQLPPAWICPGSLQLQLGDTRLALRLEDGEEAESHSGQPGCRRMRPLRVDVPPWEAAGLLQVGPVRYRIESVRSRPLLVAARDGRRLWTSSLPDRGMILGATGRELLLLLAPDRLQVVDQRDGRHVRQLRVPELYDSDEQRPSLTQWIGHVGSRGYFLLVRSQRWMMRLRRTYLAVYDGERVRLVE